MNRPEESQRRHAVQYAVSRVLADAETLREATPKILQSLSDTLGWDFGAIWRVDKRGGVLRCVDAWHREALPLQEFESVTRNRTFDRGIGLPGRVWLRGEAAWITDVVADDNFPRAPYAAKAGLHGALGFPILLGKDVLGVIEFFNREVLEPDRDLLEMMGSIGSQIGQFIQRKEAEEAIRASEARTRAILESALDCIVSIDAEGMIIEFNPAAEHTFGYRREDVIGGRMVDLLIPPHLRQTHQRSFARYLETEEARVIGRRLELEGARADGSIFPVELTVTRVSLPGPPVFTAYLRDITERRRAERERASLFDRERQARADAEAAYETLQQSLLPPTLPQIPGVQMAAAYHAAGPASKVGGDFYDVFPTGSDEWALVVGDVCGRGTQAAALTALTRYTVRAAAILVSEPQAMLAMLNEAVLRQNGQGKFCTAVAVRMRPALGSVRLTLGVAGHPLPLVLRADCTVETVGKPGMLLGAVADPRVTDVDVDLRPGDSLLLYTDGVTDVRTGDGFLGLAGLESILRSCCGLDAQATLSCLDRSVQEAMAGPPRDDMAVLVVQAVTGPGARTDG